MMDGLNNLVDQLANLDPQPQGPAPDAVAALMDQLANPEVTITFGGHFKAGKSSLLNALLDRDILPVDDLPETGVICVLQSGDRDEAVAIGPSGEQPVPVTTAALRTAIARYLPGVGQNPSVVATDRLEITLAGAPIPLHVRWIDTPGINDVEGMTERARAAARAADVLVWVLYSKQFLSLAEQEFLAEHIAERGPASVLCVVNAFLPKDTAAALINGEQAP